MNVILHPPYLPNLPDPAGTAHQPWTEGLWPLLGTELRNLPAGLGLSQSVVDRMNRGPVVPNPMAAALPYRPANIGPYLNGNAAAPDVEIVKIEP